MIIYPAIYRTSKTSRTSVLLEYLDIFNRCSTTYKALIKRLHVELALMLRPKKSKQVILRAKTNNTFQTTNINL